MYNYNYNLSDLPNLCGQCIFDEVGQLLWLGTYKVRNLFTVLEEHKSGHRCYSDFLCDLTLLVNIDLIELYTRIVVIVG